MATLETTFAGLKLKNPIIVSSSGLTDSAAKNQKLSEAGAGAIVLKSLFEEQIMMEADWMGDPNMYPEGSDYLVGYIREHKLGEYLNLIKESKKVCNIPIIASINCYQNADWVEFAAKIEEAGADALEINILALQTDVQYTYGTFEQRHIDILSHIKKTVKIPVIMKLGDNLTNPIALIDQLYANGAAAVVLFNRFYQPAYDNESEIKPAVIHQCMIDTQCVSHAESLHDSKENREVSCDFLNLLIPFLPVFPPFFQCGNNGSQKLHNNGRVDVWGNTHGKK